VREIIKQAQEIFAKTGATKEELETAINNLKTLKNAPSDSAEATVWVEQKTENEKLLTDLEAKLTKITEDPEKEGPKPDIPTPLPSPRIPPEEKELKKKYGADYQELKPKQQEGRQKIVENWKKEVNYSRKKTCRYCPQEFQYDKSSEFFSAQEKAETELKNHEAVCSVKSSPEKVKEVKQKEWEKVKKSTERHFYACRKCWGKIELDKGIADWDQSKKQARADLAYHEEHECGDEGKKKIAIYFSPNQGGNEHAPLTYAEKIKEEELELEKDNQGKIYQELEQRPVVNQPEPYNWIPWLIGGSILFLGGELLLIWLLKRRKKMKKSKK